MEQDVETALHGLFDAGHYEQVITQARRILERNPGHAWIHYLTALSQLNLKQPAAAWQHVEHLLTTCPDWVPTHHAACRYHMALRKFRQALHHNEAALAMAPDNAWYHFDAAILHLRRGDLKRARRSAELARQLEPEDPQIIRLAVEIQGAQETTARQAWQRIAQLETALALAPNDSGLHAGIGSVYLEELDLPREAEASFRSALAVNPSNRSLQKALFLAVGRQNFVYRVLSIPQRVFTWLADWLASVRRQPWRLLILLAFKLVAVFLIWLLLVTIVFWPACKAFEWLLIAEIECAAATSARRLRIKHAINRWPFWVRFAGFVILIGGVWLVFFAYLNFVAGGFAVLALVTVVHAGFTLASLLVRRLRSMSGFRSARKHRGRPFAGAAAKIPPPLPKQ